MSDFEKPSDQEEEYFAREEVEKKRRLALQQKQELESKERVDLQKLHHMKCPKCGLDLHSLEKGKVSVDYCFNCHGIWLDKGKLEQLVRGGKEHSAAVMEAVLNFVKGHQGT
jgi:uncharacterized protein